MSQSEIADLRQRLAAECEAGWQALHGLASGVAKHDIIAAKFRSMDAHHQRLTELVGADQAITMLYEIYDAIGNTHG